MPSFIRLKLLAEAEAATVQEFCTKPRQKHILRDLCPFDEWSRDGFNEMSSDRSDKIMTIILKLTGDQNSLEIRIDALTHEMDTSQQSSSTKNRITSNNSQNWRGNFRGKNNQNRGSRGI